MATEFLRRIRKEIKINLEALHEIVIAVSERVNRKVQILKLHWQASAVFQHLESIHEDLGASLCSLFAQNGDLRGRESERHAIEARLVEAASRVRVLKKELAQIDALVRELEVDTLREDLLKIQQDLSTRSATIERVLVTEGSAVIGRSISQCELSPATRVIAVFRGPTLLAAEENLVFRAGDIVVLLGPGAELKKVLPRFVERQRATA